MMRNFKYIFNMTWQMFMYLWSTSVFLLSNSLKPLQPLFSVFTLTLLHSTSTKNLHKNLFFTFFLHFLNKKYYVYYLSDTKVSFFLRPGSHHCLLFSQEPCSDNGILIGPCLSLQFYFMSPLITIFQHHFTFSQHL